MYIDFCECVYQALEMGYSHHNIARDLDGTNAARKLVLIARELGLDMNLEDIEIESLLPEGAVRVRVCLEVYCLVNDWYLDMDLENTFRLSCCCPKVAYVCVCVCSQVFTGVLFSYMLVPRLEFRVSWD